MKIAVLDSGCDFSNPVLAPYRKNTDIYTASPTGWIRTDKVNTDNQTFHGSSVCRILFDNMDKEDFHISLFQVFGANLTCDIRMILHALIYIYETMNCDIIHMSFGIRAYSSELEKICRLLYDKGSIIVSAFDNAGAVSYPAAFDFVIGVSGSLRCKTADDFVLLYHSLVDFKAKSGRQRLLTTAAGQEVMNEGNSLAAPYITAIINNLKPGTNSIPTIKKMLEPQARHVYAYDEPRVTQDISWIQSAGAFPLNKEIYNMINYAEELAFPLSDVYDIKYSGNVGRNVSSLFTDCQFIVKNYEEIAWDNFNTMILGHLGELSVLCKRDLKSELLEQCLHHGKHVYSFDRLHLEAYRERFSKAGLRLACPEEVPMPNPKLGMLFQINTPILSIFGTAKKQGKFTLQLEIRKLLREKGIRLGQIGTEPNSLMFGMDHVLPLGYDGLVISEYETIDCMNALAADIDQQDNDLLLIGAQSGFLPERFYNLGQIGFSQFSILFAAPPDGVILAVNIQDSMSHIQHTIQTIETVGRTHVFLLALYAFQATFDYIIESEKRLLSEEQIEDFRKRVNDHLHLDVIVTGDKRDSGRLFDAIIHYFCE